MMMTPMMMMMMMMMLMKVMMIKVMMMTLIWCPEQGSAFQQQASQHPSCPVLPPSATLKHLHHHHNHIRFVIVVVSSIIIISCSINIFLVAHFWDTFWVIFIETLFWDSFLCPTVQCTVQCTPGKIPTKSHFCESYHHRLGHIRRTCVPCGGLPHSGQPGLGN